MTGEVSNRRYPKEKFDTAFLEQPSVQKALARIFPYLSQDGMWRCNQCGQTICSNRKLCDLTHHKCRKGTFAALEITEVMLESDFDPYCGFCSKFLPTGAGKTTHQCKDLFFTSTLIDFSDLITRTISTVPMEDQNLKNAVAVYRENPAHVVVILEGAAIANCEGMDKFKSHTYHRSHMLLLYKQQNSLDPNGAGLFSVFSSRNAPPEDSQKEKNTCTTYPKLTTEVWCPYSGDHYTGDIPDKALSTMWVSTGEFWIDPERSGGVAYLINHSHSPNAVSIESNDVEKVYIIREKHIKAGEEICYDYCARSDDSEDAGKICNCCQGPFYKIGNINTE